MCFWSFCRKSISFSPNSNLHDYDSDCTCCIVDSFDCYWNQGIHSNWFAVLQEHGFERANRKDRWSDLCLRGHRTHPTLPAFVYDVLVVARWIVDRFRTHVSGIAKPGTYRDSFDDSSYCDGFCIVTDVNRSAVKKSSSKQRKLAIVFDDLNRNHAPKP